VQVCVDDADDWIVDLSSGAHSPDEVHVVELVEREVANEVLWLDVRDQVVVHVGPVGQPIVFTVVQIDGSTNLADVVDWRYRISVVLLVLFAAFVVIHLLLIAFDSLKPVNHVLRGCASWAVAEIDWHTSCVQLFAVRSGNQKENVVAQRVGVVENTTEERGDCINDSLARQEFVFARLFVLQ